MTAERSAGIAAITGGHPLVGDLRVPGDKSISHRAVILAAMAEGVSTMVGLSEGDDVRRTLHAVECLGAQVSRQGETVSVAGGDLRVPEEPLDLGNSGTGMRLLMGLVAGLDGPTTLVGDESLGRRPMNRVADPLALMGASVSGQGRGCLPPVTVSGGDLHGIEYSPPVASAQVKSAILLAGLWARGETVVHEPVPTRSHTEVMLAAAGAAVTVERDGSGATVHLRSGRLHPTHTDVPGDPSQAAFWVVGATVVPKSSITVRAVHASPERSGFLAVLARMGASIDVEQVGDHLVDISVRSSALRGTEVKAWEIPSLDEVPALAVAAAVAAGRSRFRDVGELRVKESDRLARTAALVRAFGGSAEVVGDDLVVDGVGGAGSRRMLQPARVDAGLDHRMAMAAAIAGLACSSEDDRTFISGWEAVATSYPDFLGHVSILTGTSPSPIGSGASPDEGEKG